MRTMLSVQLEAVSKSFRADTGQAIRAVRNVSLDVQGGEFLTLLGPSGSGKTTMLRLIAGLESPDAGVVKIGDHCVNETPPAERKVAMVFQHHALYPHLSARENLEFGLRIRGIEKKERDRRIATMADLLSLRELLARRPAELSAGERQRVALGRAVARNPGILLLDEPFASLDAPLRRELRRELLRLHHDRGLTTLLVTHDQAEALAMGQRVAVMYAGEVVQCATPLELLAKPATPFVRDFLIDRPM